MLYRIRYMSNEKSINVPPGKGNRPFPTAVTGNCFFESVPYAFLLAGRFNTLCKYKQEYRKKLSDSLLF